MKAFFSSKIIFTIVFSLVLVGFSAFLSEFPLFSVFSEKNVVNAATGSTGGGGGAGGIGGVGGEAGGGEGNNNSGTPLCGFAWGATNEAPSPGAGVGWVSFNSKDCDTNGDGVFSGADSGPTGCPTSGAVVPYGVSASSNGVLTGDAWSSNLGTLHFGGMNSSDMPNYGSNSQQNARIDGNGGNSGNSVGLSGWTRFCAATLSGDCSTMTTRPGGWDGWVSLKGNATNGEPYGVRFNSSTNKFSGFSWGGDVVGWLKWDSSSGNGVRYCTVPTLGVSLTANGVNPLRGTVAALSSVTLNATPNPLAGGGTYKFTCDRLNTALASSGSGGTSSSFACPAGYYGQAGTTYTALVELTRGELQATTTVYVITDPGVTPPTPLQVSCRAVPKPVEVNLPVTWTAEINNPSSPLPVAGYEYEFTFYKNNSNTLDVSTLAQPNPVVIPNSNNVNEAGAVLEQVQRTYSTLGNKFVVVKVTDNDTGAEGQCSPVDTSVVVDTSIIEI